MFYKKLNQAWRRQHSMLCVGLDPDINRLPACLGAENPIFSFNRAVIDATAEHVCAFKPQFAYYAAVAAEQALADTIDYIRSNYPDIVVILDAKRGDIGDTATMYAREAFERYNADAVTVNPYMGGDTLKPFSDYTDRGVVVLCRTSNPGSGDLQGIETDSGSVALRVAGLAANNWNDHHNLALVVGATWPQQIAAVRNAVADMPLLIPGIGAQGGDLGAVLTAGLDSNGYGLIVNAARSIIYASNGEDFAEAAGHQARQLKQQIRELQSALVPDLKKSTN